MTRLGGSGTSFFDRPGDELVPAAGNPDPATGGGGNAGVDWGTNGTGGPGADGTTGRDRPTGLNITPLPPVPDSPAFLGTLDWTPHPKPGDPPFKVGGVDDVVS